MGGGFAPGTRHRRLKTWAGESILIHNDHGRGFVCGDQIIQNEVLMALITPTRLRPRRNRAVRPEVL